jgi:hypothetical protein
VRIAPQGDSIRGCGVIVDQRNSLVVTVADVMGDRDSASIFHESLESGIAVKVVFRDPLRRLVLLHLERWPEGAAALPLGTGPCSPGQFLHSVYGLAIASEAAPSSWSFSRGRMQQTLMVPHLWNQCHYFTPWMVGMEPKGPFCDLGAPIVDDDGNLVGLGFDSPASGGGYLAQFFDVDKIRETLEAQAQSPLGFVQSPE